jgi:hypothetical protein
VNKVGPASGRGAVALNGDDAAALTVPAVAPNVKPEAPFCAGSPTLVVAGEAGWLPVNVKGAAAVVGVAPPPKAKALLTGGCPNGDTGAEAAEPNELL